MDDLSLNFDDKEELNALTLTALLNNGFEALSNFPPAQLIQLEKTVQQLKRQKSMASPPLDLSGASSLAEGAEDGNDLLHGTSGTASVDDGSGSGYASTGSRRRRGSQSVDGAATAMSRSSTSSHSDRHRPTGGQYMNLPASTPHVEFREGMEWLIFTYSTKGHIQEYHIRADIDDINLDDIPDDFKVENRVYARAMVPREQYVGNRYDYETIVNELAWKLCWRNPGVLTGKRGLIQRAVDSYRNRTAENRSRRVMRQEKLHSQSPYSKRGGAAGGDGSAPISMIRVPGPKTLTLQYMDELGEAAKMKIRVDIEGVDLSQIDDEFRANNAVFPGALTGGPEYTTDRWDYENLCNELGWKLAWLNSTKLVNKVELLARAVDAYHARMEAAERARQAVLQHHHQMPDGTTALYDLSTPADQSLYYQQAMAQGHHHLFHPSMMGADPQQYGAAVGAGGGLLDKGDEFSQMVAHTLQQAMAQGGISAHELAAAGFHPHQYAGNVGGNGAYGNMMSGDAASAMYGGMPVGGDDAAAAAAAYAQMAAAYGGNGMPPAHHHQHHLAAADDADQHQNDADNTPRAAAAKEEEALGGTEEDENQNQSSTAADSAELLHAAEL